MVSVVQDDRVVLLDGSAVGFTGDSLSRRIYEGVKGFESVGSLEIQEALDNLSVIRSIEPIKVTKNVMVELERKIEIFNGNVKFAKQKFFNRHSRKRKPRRRNNRIEDSNELRGENGFELIRTYTDSLYETLHGLKDVINPEKYFSGFQKHTYNVALGIADLCRENGLNHYEHLMEDPKLKLGELLNTDNRLIASAIAFTLDCPTIILTNDILLGKKLSLVQDRMRDGADIRRERGMSFISPKYRAHAMDVHVFSYLEERRLELV